MHPHAGRLAGIRRGEESCIKGPLESAMSRLDDGPPASKVTDCLGMFHSLRASAMESSWAPPKATMPTFFPIRSVGWRIFFCTTRLKGNLLAAAAMSTRSAP